MTNQISVKVSRLPEEAITELDERIDELWRDEGGDYETEEYITDDMMTTFNLLTIGYDAAWTEVERLSTALEEAQHRIGDLETGLRVSERTGMKWYDELAEAQKNYKYAAEASEMVNTALSHVAEERNALRQEMAEAQQTISRIEAENRRLGSLVPVVSRATELMSWRDPGGGKGQAEALQIIYRWALENPSPEYAMAIGNMEDACCSNPNVQTVNNNLVTNTTVCINCGRLYREGSDKA
ncbi:hypothetical protein [Paenibacillus sp. FSL R10-2771]|uniref:hypothetical protein n=1 Tax=Paenibacillus sp. FSL R10-2771 TaxID=2954693 RepID=UPI0030FC6B6B